MKVIYFYVFVANNCSLGFLSQLFCKIFCILINKKIYDNLDHLFGEGYLSFMINQVFLEYITIGHLV